MFSWTQLIHFYGDQYYEKPTAKELSGLPAELPSQSGILPTVYCPHSTTAFCTVILHLFMAGKTTLMITTAQLNSCNSVMKYKTI